MIKLAATLSLLCVIAFPVHSAELKLASSVSENADIKAQLVRGFKSQIQGLDFSSEELTVHVKDSGEEKYPYVTVEGSFDRKGYKLLWNKKLVKLRSGKKFSIEAALLEDATTLKFSSVNSKGEVDEEEVAVRISRRPAAALRPLPTVSIGLSSHSYNETRKPSFTETALTVKASYQYPIAPPQWDLEGNAYVTVLALSSSDPNYTARFFGVNVRLGYTLGVLNQPWSLRVAAGVSMNGMIVPFNKFGYGNLFYPQLYPIIRRTLDNGDSLYAYVKFASLAPSIIPSFSERELAFGGGYRHARNDGTAIIASLDVSDLQFNPKPGTNIHSSVIVLSAGYAF